MKRAMVGLFAVVALMLSMSPATSAAGHHPQIDTALAALKDARIHLIEAKHDFRGHRAEAVRAIDEAIRQLRICNEID